MYMVMWSFFVLSYALHSAYCLYNFTLIKKIPKGRRHLADDISSKITFDENLAICLSLRFRLLITISLSKDQSYFTAQCVLVDLSRFCCVVMKNFELSIKVSLFKQYTRNMHCRFQKSAFISLFLFSKRFCSHHYCNMLIICSRPSGNDKK